MDISEEIIRKRKEKISNWIKSPYTLTFLGIFILGIIIRISHFILTSEQALWWDESDYMAYAKNLAGLGGEWTITDNHISIFPYFASILFRIGLSEVPMKFLLEFIPSILIIYLVYITCLEMYSDKRIALITSFLMATSWVIIFNSNRFHVGIPALLFSFLAIYVFWKGYEKKQKIFGKINHKWALPLAVFFVIITYSIRRGFFLFGIFFLVHMLLSKDIKSLVKDKYNWIGLGLAIFLLFILEKIIFTSPITGLAGSYYHPEQTFNWLHLRVFESFFTNIFNPFSSVLLYLGYIGLILIAINLIFSMGYFRKSNNPGLKSDLFIMLAIIITLSYFIFYQRGTNMGEPRWYFTMLFAMFICVSKGGIWVADKIKKYHKHLGIVVLVILIGFGGYYEFKHGDYIVKGKLDSFSGVREASLYLNEISNPEDIIFSVPRPQVVYYSERSVLAPWELLGVPNSETTLNDFLVAIQEQEHQNIKYLIVTFSEQNHPEWMLKRTATAIEIPFMDSSINLQTQQQIINQKKSYNNITFNLLTIKGDALVYEINRA